MATANNSYFTGDGFGHSSAEQDYYRQKREYERAMAQQQAAAMNGLAGFIGQQAVRAAPPKQDPQPNPVLLLTGDDE